MIWSWYRVYPNYKQSNFFITVRGCNKEYARYAAMQEFAREHISFPDMKIMKL